MNRREFFDKSIRHTTEVCYPNKMTAKEFANKIEAKLPVFWINQNRNNKKHIEEWMQIFLAWVEIENE